MRTMLTWAAATAVLSLAGPASGQTRASEGGWWPWAGGQWESSPVRTADRTRASDRDDERDERESGAWNRGENGRQGDFDRAERGKEKNGKGPKFCRNGQGHPVHGMEWCRDKGFADGWDRARWEDVVLRQPRRDSRYGQPTLGDILGSVVLGRLTDQAHRLGLRGALDARTVDLGRNGSVLQVRAGGSPLAELTDFDRDGRADLVLLAR
jgi:hypothetical protein